MWQIVAERFASGSSTLNKDSTQNIIQFNYVRGVTICHTPASLFIGKISFVVKKQKQRIL